jgi:hypothetical protein
MPISTDHNSVFRLRPCQCQIKADLGRERPGSD